MRRFTLFDQKGNTFFIEKKIERRQTLPEERQELWTRQGGKCMLCDASLDRFAQTNHIQPLRMSVTEQVNALDNMRLLCTTCHSSATANVSQSLPMWDPLASWFADGRFTCSPRPKQLISRLNAIDSRQELLNIDAIRCRKNICMHSQWDIPVMCCYDEYFQVTPETGVADFTWIDCKTPTSHAGFLRSLPFNGSRFYLRSCVQWGLRHAKIKWTDLGLGINGSGNLPAGYLKEALQMCEEAWQQTSDKELSKNLQIPGWGYMQQISIIVTLKRSSCRLIFYQALRGQRGCIIMRMAWSVLATR